MHSIASLEVSIIWHTHCVVLVSCVVLQTISSPCNALRKDQDSKCGFGLLCSISAIHSLRTLSLEIHSGYAACSGFVRLVELIQSVIAPSISVTLLFYVATQLVPLHQNINTSQCQCMTCYCVILEDEDTRLRLLFPIYCCNEFFVLIFYWPK